MITERCQNSEDEHLGTDLRSVEAKELIKELNQRKELVCKSLKRLML